MKRCDYKREWLERAWPYGPKLARHWRCHNPATVTYVTDPRYYPVPAVRHRCAEHPLGNGWIPMDLADSQSNG